MTPLSTNPRALDKVGTDACGAGSCSYSYSYSAEASKSRSKSKSKMKLASLMATTPRLADFVSRPATNPSLLHWNSAAPISNLILCGPLRALNSKAVRSRRASACLTQAHEWRKDIQREGRRVAQRTAECRPKKARQGTAHLQASRHMSGYQRPSSISMRSKSVIICPSSLSPYCRIMSGMNPSVSSSRQPRLLMKLL